jgi:hypothetical protein
MITRIESISEPIYACWKDKIGTKEGDEARMGADGIKVGTAVGMEVVYDTMEVVEETDEDKNGREDEMGADGIKAGTAMYEVRKPGMMGIVEMTGSEVKTVGVGVETGVTVDEKTERTVVAVAVRMVVDVVAVAVGMGEQG